MNLRSFIAPGQLESGSADIGVKKEKPMGNQHPPAASSHVKAKTIKRTSSVRKAVAGGAGPGILGWQRAGGGKEKLRSTAAISGSKSCPK